MRAITTTCRWRPQLSGSPGFWIIPTRFLTGVAAAGGLAFINSVATLGGFVGPSMMGWLKEFSGSYVVGLSAVAAIMLAATAASMSLKLVISRE